MSLAQKISEWDGKSVDDLKVIFDLHHLEARFIDDLPSMLSTQPQQKGATWLIKHALENRFKLTEAQISQLFASLVNLTDWESRLHALQCFQYFQISKVNVPQVESFLRSGLDSKNKFVRAWTYSGFHTLAQQHPQFSGEVDLMLMDAAVNEAASVRARIRNLK